MDFQYNNILV